MLENTEVPSGYVYTSRTNELGVDGYNLTANPGLLIRFPMPNQVRTFFNSFCSQRGIEPSEIPLAVNLPLHDDEDMRPLVTAAVVMVFEA